MELRTFAVIAMTSTVVLAACGDGDDDKPLTSKEVFQEGRPATVALSGRLGDSVSGGTGVIIDKGRGLVVTNAHVVQGLASLKARILDREEVPARLVGTAPCQDLAVVKLNTVPEGAGQIQYGSSRSVQNQDEVTALGYPSSFAEDPTKQKVVSTNGNVQSPDVAAAPSKSQAKLPHALQHSATLNPGNSGGPLLDDRAKLVGINTLYNPGDERPVENQFYSISIDHARPIIRQLARGESVANPGFKLAAFAEVPLAQFFEATGFGSAELGQRADEFLVQRGVDGVLVTGVETDSAAEKSRIVVGDLLTAVERTPIKTVADVCEVLESATPGETLAVEGKYITSGGIERFGDDWRVRLTIPEG